MVFWREKYPQWSKVLKVQMVCLFHGSAHGNQVFGVSCTLSTCWGIYSQNCIHKKPFVFDEVYTWHWENLCLGSFFAVMATGMGKTRCQGPFFMDLGKENCNGNNQQKSPRNGAWVEESFQNEPVRINHALRKKCVVFILNHINMCTICLCFYL